MPSGNIKISASMGGLNISGSLIRSGESVLGVNVTLPVGSAGTMKTKTDADTGVATLDTGHGITDTDKVDVYWADGVHYGMDVTAVDGDDVSIDVGDGDELPIATTAIVVTKRVTIDEQFDGDVLVLFAAGSTQRAHVEFEESGGTEVAAQELIASEPWIWSTLSSFTNPLTGNAIGAIKASNGSSTVEAVLKILGIKDTVT